MPPRFDEMRIYHLLYRDEMTAMASELLRDTEVETLIVMKDSITARTTDENGVIHSLDREAKYRDLASQSGMSFLIRGANSVLWDVASGRRFQRDFMGGLRYSEATDSKIAPCRSQYEVDEAGECVYQLGDNWAIYYVWLPLPATGSP